MSIVEYKNPEWLGSDTSAVSINSRMLSRMPAGIDKTQAGFLWDVTKPVALEKAELLEYYLPRALKAMFPMWADNEWLDYHAMETGVITRRSATKAYGHVTVEGVAGVEIPAGFIFSVPSENGIAAIDFATLTDSVIDESGVITIEIEAVSAGSHSNVPKDTITIMKNPLKNITRITNAEAITGGVEAEDDESLRQRIDDYNAHRGDSFAGCPADYVRWAKEVAGVGFVRCVPIPEGANSVKLIVVDGNGEPANEKLLDEVALHVFGESRKDLARKAPIGAKYWAVVAPTKVPINYSFELKLKDGAEVNRIIELYRQALAEYYETLTVLLDDTDELVRPVKYVDAAAILTTIDCVADFRKFRINGDINNVDFGDDGWAATGEIEVTLWTT